MNMYEVRYQAKRDGDALIFFSSEAKHKYDLDDSLFEDLMLIAFNEVIDFDPGFFYEIMKLCKDKYVLYFSLMGCKINQDVIYSILSWKDELFDGKKPNLTVSAGIAATSDLYDEIGIAAYLTFPGFLSVQRFNSDHLLYGSYKKLLPKAEELYEEIQGLNLTPLETVVWIDNWFQRNVQYIKERESKLGSLIFVCPEITEQAIVPDVFLHGYGTCEDITVSVVTLLSKLGIPCEVFQGNEHAWLDVMIDGKYYIWDCTHNISRGKNRLPQAMKQSAYTSEYTLIGSEKEPYLRPVHPLIQRVEDKDFPRERIQEAVQKLKVNFGISFEYGDKPLYNSYIK